MEANWGQIWLLWCLRPDLITMFAWGIFSIHEVLTLFLFSWLLNYRLKCSYVHLNLSSWEAYRLKEWWLCLFLVECDSLIAHSLQDLNKNKKRVIKKHVILVGFNCYVRNAKTILPPPPLKKIIYVSVSHHHHYDHFKGVTCWLEN